MNILIFYINIYLHKYVWYMFDTDIFYIYLAQFVRNIIRILLSINAESPNIKKLKKKTFFYSSD